MVSMTQQPLTFSVWLAGIIERWRMVLKVMAVVLVSAALAAILIPPVYEAHASFVTSSSTAAKWRARSVARGVGYQALLPNWAFSPGADPSESPSFYVKLIESEELRRRLLNSRFHNPRSASPRDSATLLEILRIRNSDSVRRMEIALKKMQDEIATNFDIKTNVVQLAVSSRWSETAAAMANRTVALVDRFNFEQRVSRARSKRIFVQGRLDSAKLELQGAEQAQRFFYDQNRQWRTSPQLVFEEGRLRRNVDVRVGSVPHPAAPVRIGAP